ncbi:MAG: hypothetical protein IPK79_06290 [Vampirovibrionales bacterium]|nr:hypothetical protein [Vampirovibrionales bacterium]
MWARSPSFRYAPFLMALLTNLGLFGALMDALYADSQEKVRAWASYFSRYCFPVLMDRHIRQQSAQKPEPADKDTSEGALALVNRLLAMLQEPKDATHPPNLSAGRAARDIEAALSGQRPCGRGFPDDRADDRFFSAQWGDPPPNPRASRGKSPHFPRLRLIELLQRQRILLSNPAWGMPNYAGWWDDPAIAPERLDDIARALQPRSKPTLLPALMRAAGPEPPSDSSDQPEKPLTERLFSISDRDRRLLRQLKPELGNPTPRRQAEDARHPP